MPAAVLPVNAASPGTVVAWGWNAYGQTYVPAGLSGVTAIAAGKGSHRGARRHSAAAATDHNFFRSQCCFDVAD